MTNPPSHKRPPRQRRSAVTVPLGVVGCLLLAASAAYTIRPGDTLSHIARLHEVSVQALAELNDIVDVDRIFAGTVLRLPGSGPGRTSDGAYVVSRGDTLSGIAAGNGVTVADLVAANGLSDPNHLRVGTRLTLPGRVVGPAGAPTARTEVGELIARTAREHGWNPAFVQAVAWQESGWDNAVLSSAGAVGIMQVLPGTGEFVSGHLAGRRLDLHDPADNVLAGVLFLDYLYGLTGGDAELTLAGYYQGLRSVRENGMYPSTERYIANVLALRERFS